MAKSFAEGFQPGCGGSGSALAEQTLSDRSVTCITCLSAIIST